MARQKPFRLKIFRVGPDTWVTVQLPRIHEQAGAFWNVVASNMTVFHGFVWHRQKNCCVQPQGFLDNGLEAVDTESVPPTMRVCISLKLQKFTKKIEAMTQMHKIPKKKKKNIESLEKYSTQLEKLTSCQIPQLYIEKKEKRKI